MLGFVISLMLSVGQERNLFLAVPVWPSPDFHTYSLWARFRILLCWLCCSMECNTKLKQPESPTGEFLFI